MTNKMLKDKSVREQQQLVAEMRVPPAPLTAAQIAVRARDQIADITGLDVDHVSAIEKDERGWCVTVDLVELRRIPAATDVLGAYEVILGDLGDLVSYHRSHRYFRDQMLVKER